MRPIRTTIQGFGPHEDTTVDWSKLQSPIVITAPTGTGKTWLMGSIVAVLFGKFAWYSKSIYNGLTLGGNGVGHLEMDFEHDGAHYRAKRIVKNTGKTKIQKAFLHLIDPADGMEKEMIAGPKINDFDRAIFAMIGDRKMFMATCFCTQDRELDLCGQPSDTDLAARRRKVFNTLIGTSVLDPIEKRVANAARTSKIIVEELEAQLAGGADPAETLPEKKGELSGLRAVIETKRAEVAAAEQNLEEARTRLRDAEGGDDVLQAQIDEYERAESALGDLRRRAEKLTAEIEAAEKIAGGLSKALADTVCLMDLDVFRETLRNRKTAYEAWEKYETRRAGMAGEIQASKNLFSSLGDVGAVDQETIELSGRLEELREEYKIAQRENNRIKGDNQAFALQRNALSSEIKTLEGKCGDAEERLKERPETLFGERCTPCPFVSDWTKIPAVIRLMEGNIDNLQYGLERIPDDTPEIDVAAIQIEGERAANARKNVEGVEEAKKIMESARANHEAMKTAYADFLDQNQQYIASAPCNDPSQDLLEAQEKMDALAGASERVKACEVATATLLEKNQERDGVCSGITNLDWQLPALRDKAGAAKQALADRESQRATTRLEVEQKEKALEDVRGEGMDISLSIARLEALIEGIERRAVERQEKYDRVRQLRDELDGYADLRKCFGPHGVRSILIDNSAPELEAIANDLFKRATGGKMALRIATQSANADGSIAETFDILVMDKKGERDVLEYSGGELQLILILFRVAQAIWVGNLREKQPDALFFDEAMTGMDPEWAESIMRLIEYIENKIKMFVVITHNIGIASRMKSRIQLETRLGGVSITTS